MRLSSILFIILCFQAEVVKSQESSFNFQNKNFLTHLTETEPVRYSTSFSDQVETKQVYPNPKSVFRKSLIIPGWGQIINKQAWKVPIVYGLIGGLTYYSIDLTKQYHDYRAAYFNVVKSDPNDFRFGPTPPYLVGSTNNNALRNNRDFLRNRRDFIYITIALSHLLNGVDAYVFAHFRSFDVSDDLTLNTRLQPEIFEHPELGEIASISVKLKFNFIR